MKYIFLIITLFLTFPCVAQKNIIKPGEIWPDQHGDHIQAHGGGIIKLGKYYYWYGEERRKGLDTNLRFVSCYRSENLATWKFEGDVVKMSDPEQLGTGWVLERPKVYHRKSDGKFVMYFHLDNKNYSYARVGVAISDKANGDFKFIKSFRPLNRPSRDIGQFIDDDGSNYLIFEDRELGFHIVKLSTDLLSVEKEMSLVNAPLEGGAIVHYKNLYYAIGSALTGWAPNPNKFASSKSLSGPWTKFGDIAPLETNTYKSQSTMMLKVVGSRSTTVIFMGDQWNPAAQWDSRYLWMPLTIGNGKLWLPNPQPWKINVRTGETTLVKN
ncbi:family 43 glycosylhydrolase [Mucilaginibacter endophyticus]|uniref:family 43 glycosylhydrolase n=1 Tax=Mucilaginibacter endophyticus TaxID=2675003 RepID=UPI000E0D754D|nr:family 43 glycosylhydrolase [Mucilaginibacter endophyticus]